MSKYVICSRCKEPHLRETYMKNGKELKMCEYCRKLKAKYRKAHPQPKNQSIKCPHNRRRNQCVDCGGASICEHKARRERCSVCSPKHINYSV